MTDRPTPPANPVGIGAAEPLSVECIVRPDVSAVSQQRIDAIYSRLEALEETALVEGVTRSEWPPHQHARADDAADRVHRRVRVDRFERWADERDCSLKPAFRRQRVPDSLLDRDGSYETVRVPVVTLALSTADDDTLAGVVPYTVDYGTDDATTYTVDNWLSAAEAATVPERADGPVVGTRSESA
jgi:hypothetical protein